MNIHRKPSHGLSSFLVSIIGALLFSGFVVAVCTLGCTQSFREKFLSKTKPK